MFWDAGKSSYGVVMEKWKEKGSVVWIFEAIYRLPLSSARGGEEMGTRFVRLR